MKRIFAALCMIGLVLSLGTNNAQSVYDSEVFFDVSDLGSPEDEQVFFGDVPVIATDELSVSAPGAILIEKETGTVIYEKDADTKREPASVTKVMTILLIVEALQNGNLSIDEAVTTSAYAASMGGSQVFLEEGEQMTVREMLKAIVVASANDAAVAMAEHLSGSESVFVARMNERALELGMVNTNFTNCTGLLDDTSHVTTPRDIAIMSRELIEHDMIKEYTTIWMETIRNGQFGLSNTNKLIRFYDGATGLKTGFTQRSKYCLSATAERGGIEYIAVVMYCETSPERFESAKTLLNYAFANYTTIPTAPDEALKPIPVTLGKHKAVQPIITDSGRLLLEKRDVASISKVVEIAEELKAPVKAGDVVGKLRILRGSEQLGEYDIIADSDVKKLKWFDIFAKLTGLYFIGE